MELDELKARARERMKALNATPNDGLDAFQRDALSFFSRIPEPPLYRRRDDPSRAAATAMLVELETLLARAWRLGSIVDLYAEALEAHALSLLQLASGRVETAEPAWLDAQVKERKATAPLRLWSRTDAERPAVFVPQLGTSRFDPRPEAQVEAKLVCPQCKKVSAFSLSPRVATHEVPCPQCKTPFGVYVAELRLLEIEPLGRQRRRYRFRVDDLSGLQTRVEFEDATPGELGASRRDLLAFLYLPASRLRGVLNLNTSRVLWITEPGACFVATVAFGEGADELTHLRAFRDRVLERSAAGRAFVDWYYREGASLAAQVQRRPSLVRAVRLGLRAVVPLLRKVP